MKNISIIFQKITNTSHEKISITILTLLGIVFYLIRLPNLAYIENTLWAEDGSIFFNSAVQNGVSSLFETYAGYSHLYPRICALLASYISIKYTPYLYFFASLIPCALLAYAIAKRLQENGFYFKTSLLAIFFLFLQPCNGEVFYNISDAHWFICIAMAVWIILSTNSKPSIFELILLAIGALTGPFVIFMAPAIILKLIKEHKARSNVALYSTLFICAIIQALLIIFSSRIYYATPVDKNLHHWLQQLLVYFSFGLWPHKKILSLVLIPFWLVLLKYIFTLKNHPKNIKPALLFLTAVILYGAALFHAKRMPTLLHPFKAGSRYYFSSYALIIVCIFMLTARSTYKTIVATLSLAIACLVPFKRMDRPDMHWMAYYAFVEKIPGIAIPLHPVSKEYPSWHAKIPESLTSSKNSNKITTIPTYPKERETLTTLDAHPYSPQNNPSYLRYAIPAPCKEKRYLAFQAEIEISKAGIVRFFWKDDVDYNDNRVNWQFFNAGKTPMFFAIPNTNIQALRLEISDEIKPYSIFNANILCSN